MIENLVIRKKVLPWLIKRSLKYKQIGYCKLFLVEGMQKMEPMTLRISFGGWGPQDRILKHG